MSRLRDLMAILCLWACERPSMDPDDSQADTQPSQDTTGDDTGLPAEAPLMAVDVLIVGAGAAGLAAATVLEDSELDYLLVEVDSQVGGTALYTGAWMVFSGTEEQEAAGIEDSAGQLLAEWNEMTGGDPEDPWVQLFASRNVEVHDWLSDRGVGFALGSLAQDGASVRRVHMTDGEGGALVSALRSGMDESQIWTDTRCTELVIDLDGQVRGAWVERSAGTGWVQAGTTLVATGGFLRNLDLVAWARPDLDTDALWFSTGPQALGLGHEMLDAAGAAWDNPSALSIYAHGVADPRSEGEELILLGVQPLAMFNSSGSRFTSEAPDNSYGQGRDLVAQEGQLGWYVFDSSTRGTLVLDDPMVLESESELPSLEALEKSGQLGQEDSLAELAASLGMDPDGLLTAVDSLNQSLDEGTEDTLWGSTPEMERITEPPFYGIRVVPTLAKAFGGIEVDTSGRALDSAGSPIPGLRAAGELTGMAGGSLVGDSYFAGSLSAVILSGWVAAESLINE